MARNLRLSAGELELELEPAMGGAVTAFRAGGEPVFRPSPEPLTDVNASGCYPLVPFSNRVRDGRFTFRGREVRLSPNLPPQPHPLHGQGWRGVWSVAAAGDGWIELVFDHAPGEWPWAYQARQLFSLDPDGLTIRLDCRNMAEEPMPCGLGLHPWFPANAETVLDTEVAGVWTIDAEVMPVALEPPVGRYDLRRRRIAGADLDNGYEGWSGLTEIAWPDRGLAVRISSQEARRFQVYAPPEGGVVVAEPVVNANAALNQPEDRWPELGLTVLEPGETAFMSARFEVVRPRVAS
jgi:aldose 1-epimerase